MADTALTVFPNPSAVVFSGGQRKDMCEEAEAIAGEYDPAPRLQGLDADVLSFRADTYSAPGCSVVCHCCSRLLARLIPHCCALPASGLHAAIPATGIVDGRRCPIGPLGTAAVLHGLFIERLVCRRSCRLRNTGGRKGGGDHKGDHIHSMPHIALLLCLRWAGFCELSPLNAVIIMGLGHLDFNQAGRTRPSATNLARPATFLRVAETGLVT
jgi:hypothetical protein